MCVTPETPQYTAFFVSFGDLLDFGQNYFTFANSNLQLTYCNRHIIRRIKLYCYKVLSNSYRYKKKSYLGNTRERLLSKNTLGQIISSDKPASELLTCGPKQ